MQAHHPDHGDGDGDGDGDGEQSPHSVGEGHHSPVDPEAIAASMREQGFEADGRVDRLASRPVKRIDARLPL